MQSITIYEGKQSSDMAKFLTKINENDEALAPYVEHIVFTDGIDNVENNRFHRMDYNRFALEWAICKNVRTITMPVAWATFDTTTHKPIWQYFDIDADKQYEYKYKGVTYIVIGDTKAPRTEDGEENVERFTARNKEQARQFLERFCTRGSKLQTNLEHLILELNPAALSPQETVELLACDEYRLSVADALDIGWHRFLHRAIRALFNERNSICSLVLHVQWFDVFEQSGSFPKVNFQITEPSSPDMNSVFIGEWRYMSVAFGTGDIEEDRRRGVRGENSIDSENAEDPGWDAVHTSLFNRRRPRARPVYDQHGNRTCWFLLNAAATLRGDSSSGNG